MKIKTLVAALAALSLTGAAFADQAVQQQTKTPKQARHASRFAPKSALSRALTGNSYAGYVPHNYLRGHHGMWIGGFGQLIGTYNTNYLLGKTHDHGGWSPIPKPPINGNNSSNTTIGLPHADVLFGYDSHQAGFVFVAGYSDMPYYHGGGTSIITIPSSIEAHEAYMTYRFNKMVGIKAGKFIGDFGSYDPTEALLSLPAALEATDVTGIEGVVATHGFHGSVTAAMQQNASEASSSGFTNDARPNTFIVNGGYDMPFRGATVGIEASYNNKATEIGVRKFEPAWTVGAHYGNGTWIAKADVLNERAVNKDGTRPWIWSGSVDYKIGKYANHGMVVGAYGNYIKNPSAALYGVHWILGAKFGYCVNRYVDATAYLQQAEQAKDTGNKSNTTAMLALTVKV